MLWPNKNSYKEFDKENIFLRLENSPSPPSPITFLMVGPLKDIRIKWGNSSYVVANNYFYNKQYLIYYLYYSNITFGYRDIM